ncbi:MAG TPA: chemotaxis protein CheR, partial [Verrucomicrobia bacterium]|nr:chemotaxis protein CheR [Verrucomicrobiota bacterium]
MSGQLVNFSRHPFAARGAEAHPHIPEGSSQLERICSRLREVTNIDFSHYKHATFARRIERRMNISQVQDIQEYIQCLTQSSREAEALGKDLLIGVTKFFRDAESFRVLTDCIRQRFDQTPDGQTLRVWSAACSTGEEAYTLAMLCEEIRAAYRPRVEFNVFATDIDKSALEIASAGIYPRSVVADLPRELLDRYFLQDGAENFRVIRSLRDRLIFAKQDLLSDPPFTKIDLICCRNLMIYLRPEAQRKLLSLFHFSLTPGGLLFLGSSETLGDLSYAFETIDSKHRIHSKAAGVALRVSDAIHTLDEGSLWTSFVDDHGTRTRGRRSATNSSEAIQQHLLKRFA